MDLEVFILDVDGVLTDGKFYYSQEGKVFKKFGPHDSDGLKIISKYLKIQFISADKRGFDISNKRIKDMGYSLSFVTEDERADWLNKNCDLSKSAYMGDGLFDIYGIKNSLIGISPANALQEVKDSSNYVTHNIGGEGAVFEACMYILKFVNETTKN